MDCAVDKVSDTPRTDAIATEGSIYSFGVRITKLSRELERELAAAIEQRDKASGNASKELMDCKGYDLYPDGTMRPAHGLGEWVKAEDYDKLHAEIAMLRKDTERLDWLDTVDCGINQCGYGEYRDYTGRGFIKKIREVVDAAMKECWK